MSAGRACVASALALSLAGCGGARSASQEDATRAFFEESSKRCRTLRAEGAYDQVKLHNSGVSCQKAVAMIYVLAGAIKRPQRVTASHGPPWLCLNLSPAKLPLKIRCHQGGRYFTVERVKISRK